jgi:hypothetical protein
MQTFNKKILSILSLLNISGMILMHYFWGSNLVLIPIVMCAIGGLSFGTLIGKIVNNED